MTLINLDGTPMQRSTVPAVRPSASTAYQAADPISQDLMGWNPWITSADADLLPERDTIVGRIRDLVRNNGWASSAVRRELDSVIGSGLRLSAKPDWRALGLDAKWALDFGREVESLWRSFTHDPGLYCDAARHHTMGGLFGLAYRHYVIDGDALAILQWLPDRGGPFATAVQVIDPDRLSNPQNRMDDDLLRAGVEIDEYGAAVAYHIRKRHPYDVPTAGAMNFEWMRVPRDTPWGRPIVIHFYDKDRSGLSRGVGRLTPVLERLKMLDKYDKVELQAAVLNAVLAAFIESPFDHNLLHEILEEGNGAKLNDYQAARAAYAKDRRINLGGVRVASLFPGEKLEFQTAARPNTAFAEFEAACLRNIAAGTGIGYEQLSMDWSSTTYLSARAMLLEVWKTLSTRREAFSQGFCRQIYLAFLEEIIDRGDVTLPAGAPEFYDARGAYGRCRWIGPGRGWVDPVKEKQGAIIGIAAGLSTLEDEAAEQGKDWEEIQAQLEIEIASMPKGILHPAQKDYTTLITATGNQDKAEGNE